MTGIEITHVHGADGRNLCGQEGGSVTLNEAHDPDDGKTFSCGRCLSALSNVTEPAMGGST